MSKYDDAIKHFVNMRDGNFATLDDFRKQIESGKINGSAIVYENRDRYYNLAIEALREAAEREKGCPKCSAPFNYNCTIRTQRFSDGAVLAIHCGENQPYIHAICRPNKGDATVYSVAEKIIFCPMCGKRLTKEPTA